MGTISKRCAGCGAVLSEGAATCTLCKPSERPDKDRGARAPGGERGKASRLVPVATLAVLAVAGAGAMRLTAPAAPARSDDQISIPVAARPAAYSTDHSPAPGPQSNALDGPRSNAEVGLPEGDPENTIPGAEQPGHAYPQGNVAMVLPKGAGGASDAREPAGPAAGFSDAHLRGIEGTTVVGSSTRLGNSGPLPGSTAEEERRFAELRKHDPWAVDLRRNHTNAALMNGGQASLFSGMVPPAPKGRLKANDPRLDPNQTHPHLKGANLVADGNVIREATPEEMDRARRGTH